MRVTNGMMISNMLKNLNSNLNVMSRKQDELSTGKKVIFASDNPVAAAKILKFKTDIADMEQYAINTRDGQAWLDASESTIAETGQVLQRIRELSVKAANGTNTPSDLLKIKEEVVQLRENLINGANFNFAGRYIFSSHYTDKPLLKADGSYNIPITAQDITDKPVSVYEISSNEFMPIGTHGLSIYGYIPEISEFQNKMPDLQSSGVAAEKSGLKMDFSLIQNYSAGANIEVSVNGTTYTIDKTKLNGSALKPIDLQTVTDAFNSGSNGTNKLSSVADVYFDNNKKLVIRNKTVGTGGTVQLSAFTGVTNPTNVTNLSSPVAMGAMTDLVTGINSVGTAVTSATNLVDADTPDFLGKQFVMTVNGLTKTITIPNDPAITTAAQLDTAVQTQVDNAFGAGQVVVGMANGAPISFTTVTGPGEAEKANIRIQPVKATQNELIKEVNEFIGFLATGDNKGCSNMIKEFDDHLNTLLAVRADIGARGSRLELVGTRISENAITFTRLLSDAQDADMSEVIMNLKNAENVYKAALSVGGRIIQPSLVDFIR